MRLPMILAIARAEIRSIRRLVRYWMFSILSVAITFLIYLYHAGIHGLVSRFSATVGAGAPRYLMAFMGIFLMAIFLLGLIFLAFDVRARDERERIAEVLDVRPLSNPELLVGRGLGLVLMALAPGLFVAVTVQVFGSAALLFDWYLGEPVEPYSLVAFTFDALSVSTLWCVVVMLLAVLVRNRLVVVLGALVLFGLQFWLVVRWPVSIYFQPILGSLIGSGAASDLVPSLGTGADFARRGALWLLAAGGLALAAAFHPRPDSGSTVRRIALGAGLVAVAGLIMGTMARQAGAELDRRAGWLAAHQARRDDARADMRAVTGTVRIEPGRHVALALALRVQAPPGGQLDTLLFTLNPGLVVERVAVGGADATWTHASGLLEVTPASPVAAAAETTVDLVASGRPDIGFGYLDSAFDLGSGPNMNRQLGREVGVFSSRYVALMPGLGWLPHLGSDVPAGDPRTHPADFFEVELAVEVPAGWLVAGPGRRQTLESGGNVARFRFRPGAPVPQVGLLAARFERRAIEVAGVELEILVHPTHDRNLRFFDDAADAIRTRAEEIFTDAEALGLPYPYGGLTLVESPSTLRGYGGGWRMDTTQAMPGVLLLRENSFTTARFEFEFRDPDSFAERDGGLARAKVEAIERFFENDVSGGNLFLGGSRNFLLFQTGARGEGALAIDFVIDELVNLLLTGKRGYFSVFTLAQPSDAMSGDIITNMVTGQMDSVVEAVLAAVSDRPSVWDRALGSSMADLEPTEDPSQALNVLALKSHAIARSILDGLGREKTAALLAALRARYRGRHFTAADLAQVASELAADLDPLIGDWLHEATLPGFVTSPVVVERLADDAQGTARYQTRVHVRNDEATPGLLRLRYRSGEETTATRWDETEPVRLAGHEAVEIGVLSSTPPRALWLQPYLSLNRHDVQLTLPRVDQEAQVGAEPFLGVRPSGWRPVRTADIVIDDLDPGFSVEVVEAENGRRLGGGRASVRVGVADMDQGLPESSGFTGAPTEWSRRAESSSWGRYRHTIALIGRGAGTRRAVFTTTLPHAGRWRLAYHIPALTSRTTTTNASSAEVLLLDDEINAPVGLGGSLGTYDVTVRAGGEERSLEFDGAAVETGWNTLGEFYLSEGEARLEVSDETSGRLVIADAVRWQSVSEDK